MRRILYTRPDGGVSVVHPIINTHGEEPGMTEAKAEQRAWDRLPPDAINPQWIEVSAIPEDRTFRNGWEQVGASIAHNLPKCKELCRQHIRELRKPRFEPLERAQRTALTKGEMAKAAELEVQLQALRDATADPRIEGATAVDELKAILRDWTL